MKKISVLIVLAGLLSMNTFSQELSCRVSINTSQIQGTNKEIFNTLRDAIADFMNNRTWTNNVFEVNERIECNLMFNITKEITAGEYQATLSVQARRPVYGTSYNTVMLNYFDDDVKFEYTEFYPLEFSETSFINNLTSIMAYYAYIILGLDYDSFSLNGGTPYFQKAEKIVTNAQSASYAGWKAFEARGRDNRYWLVTNILDDGYGPLRQFNYSYHRLGLDVMDKNLERGRMIIKEGLIELEKFYKSKPDPFIHFYQVVLDSKSDEIVKIFSEANQADKQRVFTIMKDIDPANSSKYDSLKE